MSKQLSVLESHFDKSINQNSPCHDDFTRVSKFDEDGREIVMYEKSDYTELIASHGTVLDWSLDSLLKAGINPNFSIHTSGNSRIEASGDVKEVASQVEAAFTETKVEPKNE